ncbi:hypothetical protein RRG08_046452 [Elysia crispata]|uniref:Uncharacterized protein n=1 Tax=Elysia crispata TaxID=231223 RepID=A0AAE1CZ88_9GAST|nr:hypothetical protein RRG08_046452 [Elysia crispata]
MKKNKRSQTRNKKSKFPSSKESSPSSPCHRSCGFHSSSSQAGYLPTAGESEDFGLVGHLHRANFPNNHSTQVGVYCGVPGRFLHKSFSQVYQGDSCILVSLRSTREISA